MPGGQPTKYQPEFCETLVDFMGQGFSKTATAGYLGVCYHTILNWEKAHPKFLDAVKRGVAARTMKLEGDLLDAKDGPMVTSRIFALKNAAPLEWRDKTDTTHHAGDGMAELFATVASGGKRITDD